MTTTHSEDEEVKITDLLDINDYPAGWPTQAEIDHFLEDKVPDDILLQQWAKAVGVSYNSVTKLKENRQAAILRAMRQRLFNECKAHYIRVRYQANVVPGLLQHAIDRVEFLVEWMIPPSGPDRARFERAFLQAQADYYRSIQNSLDEAVEQSSELTVVEAPKDLILPPGVSRD